MGMAPRSGEADTRTDTVTSNGRFLQYGILTVIAVNFVNLTVLFIGLSVVEFPAQYVGGQFGPLAVVPVAANSTVAAVGATIVYGIIARYSRRPNRAFTVVAGVVFVLSFAMFLAPDLSGAPLDVFVTLGVMHVIAVAVTVGVLTRIPQRTVESNGGEK